MKTILKEIKKERVRQQDKFGQQDHNIMEWQGILMEEVEEVVEEASSYYYKFPYKYADGRYTGVSSDTDPIQINRLKNYRKELIQVAALAVQMIECLDRNHPAL